VNQAISAIEEGISAVSEAADGSADLEKLLEQLKVEPIDAVELEAKFTIFDEYLSTVVLLRDQVYSLWARGMPRLEAAGTAAANIARRLKSIDGFENLAVEEPRHGQWIVYGMARCAARNHAALSSVLREIETKLALVARDDVECPFCLEICVMPKILSCCHKSCGECWQHWLNVSAAEHSRPFCPFCHHVEFVETIQTYATVRSATRQRTIGATAAGPTSAASTSGQQQ
jgi:hypothetical protein